MIGLHHGIWIQVCDVFPVPLYEFVIKCKVVLVVVILCLEKQRRVKEQKPCPNSTASPRFGMYEVRIMYH